ncbi:ABC-2 family transporter protein [Candidatus Woesebacteria bacterium]|nr:ABC-2 family transporter protein [Candidatus Woesebacteria bacterium]
MKSLKIFWLFSKYSLKTTFTHKTGVILFTVGKLLRFGMFFAFVFFLLSNTKFLGSYSLEQTIVFYLTYNIIDSIAQLMFREVYRFRQLVVSGELDTVLVKPYHPFLRILVGGIDFLDAGMIFLFFSILVCLLCLYKKVEESHLPACSFISP